MQNNINPYGIDCIGNSALNDGLSDGVVKLKSLWDWVAGLTGFSYERCINVISTNLNYNQGWKCRNFPALCPDGFYNDYDIEKVVNSYGNLVVAGTIEVFNPEKLDAIKQYDIIHQVSTASGVNYVRTQKILIGLYYWTKDGQIPTSAYISPLVFKENNATRNLPQDWNQNSLSATISNTSDSLLTYAKYGLGVILVGGILYVGLQGVSAYKTAKAII